jgi:hypothetical protein
MTLIACGLVLNKAPPEVNRGGGEVANQMKGVSMPLVNHQFYCSS